jgi:hypothetical protein
MLGSIPGAANYIARVCLDKRRDSLVERVWRSTCALWE